jgi:hypothetical protein
MRLRYGSYDEKYYRRYLAEYQWYLAECQCEEFY